MGEGGGGSGTSRHFLARPRHHHHHQPLRDPQPRENSLGPHPTSVEPASAPNATAVEITPQQLNQLLDFSEASAAITIARLINVFTLPGGSEIIIFCSASEASFCLYFIGVFYFSCIVRTPCISPNLTCRSILRCRRSRPPQVVRDLDPAGARGGRLRHDDTPPTRCTLFCGKEK